MSRLYISEARITIRWVGYFNVRKSDCLIVPDSGYGSTHGIPLEEIAESSNEAPGGRIPRVWERYCSQWLPAILRKVWNDLKNQSQQHEGTDSPNWLRLWRDPLQPSTAHQFDDPDWFPDMHWLTDPSACPHVGRRRVTPRSISFCIYCIFAKRRLCMYGMRTNK